MAANIHKLGLSFLLTFFILSSAGCVPLLVGAAAGVGGVTYVKGALEKNFDHSVKEVHRATLKGLKDLKMFVREEKNDVHSTFIKAEFDDGKRVKIHINALTERSSKITIRIGVFGDETKSQILLNAIQKRLG